MKNKHNKAMILALLLLIQVMTFPICAIGSYFLDSNINNENNRDGVIQIMSNDGENVSETVIPDGNEALDDVQMPEPGEEIIQDYTAPGFEEHLGVDNPNVFDDLIFLDDFENTYECIEPDDCDSIDNSADEQYLFEDEEEQAAAYSLRSINGNSIVFYLTDWNGAQLPNEALQSAKYDLYYKWNNTFNRINTHTNVSPNEYGQLIFSNVPYGASTTMIEYYVKEVENPYGYINPNGNQNITASGIAYFQRQNGNFVVGSEYTVNPDTIQFVKSDTISYNPAGRFIVDKVDEEDAPLQGVEFNLKSKNGAYNIVKSSDNDGKIIFDNLFAGEYVLTETVPLVGYEKVKDTWNVTVENNGKTNVVKNTAMRLERDSNIGMQSPFMYALEDDFSISIDNIHMRDGDVYEYNDTMNPRAPIVTAPYCKNDPVKGVTVTNNSQGVSLTQRIVQTSQKGTYKVDVEVSGDGIVNEYSTDYVFVVENTWYNWFAPPIGGGNNRMCFNMSGYRNRIEEFIQQVSSKQSNVRVGVVVAGETVKETVPLTNISNMGNSLSVIDTTGADEDKNWGVGINRAIEMLSTSDATNKVIINLTCGGLNFEGSLNDVERLKSELFRSSSVNIVGTNSPLKICENRGIDVYYTAEWKKNGWVYHGDTNSLEYYLNGKSSAIKGVATMFADAADYDSYAMRNAYNNTLSGFVEKYNNTNGVGPGYLRLTLSDGLIFHSLDNTSGKNIAYNASNKQIVGSSLKFKKGEKLNFSYYITSDAENLNAVYNTYRAINSQASYWAKSYSDGTYSPRVDFPIPQVAIPAIRVDIKETWDSDIPMNKRTDSVYFYKKVNTTETPIASNMAFNATQNIRTFDNLPIFNNAGQDIEYIVKTMSGAYKRYVRTLTYSTGGNSIYGTNGSVGIHIAYKKKNLEFQKNWHYVDESEWRLVTLRLIGSVNGIPINLSDYGVAESVQQVVLGGDGVWSGSFNNLREYDDNDLEISYSVEELGVEGHSLDEYDIEYIDINDKTIISNTKKSPVIKIVNERIKRFYLKKLDEMGNPMEGVEFELTRNLTGEKIIRTTDAKGEIEFSELEEGAYTIIEKRTKDGYKRLLKSWAVFVDAEGNVTYNEENSRGERALKAFIQEDFGSNISYKASNSREDLASFYPYNDSDPAVYTNENNDPVTVAQSNTGFANPGVTKGRYVVNSTKAEDDFYYYNGSYDGEEIITAGVNKFADPTSLEGRFNINLTVTGNTIESDESTDIVILYDASRSMNNFKRVAPAYEATKQFVESILSAENNAKGKYRIALVTYAGDIFDGRVARAWNHYSDGTYGYRQSTMPNHSHKSFTTNANDIISKIYNDVSETWYKGAPDNVWFGGTFTSKGFMEAEQILRTSNAQNKYIVHVTDGMPTKSLIAESYDSVRGVFKNFRSHDSMNALDVYAFDVKGDGTSLHMHDKDNGQGVHDRYGVRDENGNSVAVNNHGEIAVSYAKKIMYENSNVEIFTLGVNIDEDDFLSYVKQPNLITADAAKELMIEMSTDELHYYDVDDLNKLVGMYYDIVKRIHNDTLQNGEVIDPMGEMVKINIGSDGVFDESDYVLTDSYGNIRVNGVVRDNAGKVVLNGTILHAIDVSLDGDILRMKGLNLGKNESVHLKYSVDLRTEHPDYEAGKFYFTNKDTYLKPNSDYDILWKFPIPAVRGRKDTIIAITNLPNHAEFKKVSADNYPLSGVIFNLYRSGSLYKSAIESENDGGIYFDKLPVGEYSLREVASLDGYKLIDYDISFTVNEDGEVLYAQGQEAPVIITNFADKPPMKFYIVKNANGQRLNQGELKIKIANLPFFDGEDVANFDLANDYTADGLEVLVPLDVESGEYILTEEKAPAGFTKIFDKFVINVNQDKRRISLLRIEKSDGSIVEVNETLYSESMVSETGAIYISPVEIENFIAEYPGTGGFGAALFVAVGCMAMIASMIELKKKI